MSIESKGARVVVVEFCTHEQNDLLVHTQHISLAWALTCFVVVEIWPSSLDLPSN
jgi:hypothetical protein